MKRTILSCLAVCMLCTLSANAQRLVGTLVDEERAGAPIAMADISILGHGVYGSTNSDGTFEIDLQNCSGCTPGEEVLFIIKHPEYGFHEIRHTLGSNMRAQLGIRPNNIVGIYGHVYDEESKASVSGVTVTYALSNQRNAQRPVEVTTDEYGRFTIVLRKEKVGELEFVEIICRDGKGRYKDYRDLMDVRAALAIPLEKGSEQHPFKVGRFENTGLKISKGDYVIITARGSIRIGPFAGSSSPRGRESGVGGLSLESYNVFMEFPHAALLYKIDDDGNPETDFDSGWAFSGDNVEFTSQEDGYLMFLVNDREYQNNAGNYDVRVRIE